MFFATSLTLALATLIPHGGEKEALGKPIASLFPAKSYAFAQFAGLERCRSASDALGLVKLLERFAGHYDSDLIPADLERELRRIDKHLAQVGLNRGRVRALLQGGIGIGVGRMTIAGMVPAPSVAVALDIRTARQEVRGVLDMAGQMLGSMGVKVETKKLEGYATRVVDLPDMKLLVTLTEQYLIVSNSPGYLRDCLRCMAGQHASMADNEMVQAGRKRFDGEELASVFLNVDVLTGWLGGFLPYEAEDLGAALGIMGLQGVYIGAGTTVNNSREIVHIGIQGPKDGLIRSILGNAVSHESASLCPDDTLFYATARLDPRRAAQAIERILDALPKHVSDEIRGEFHQGIVGELAENGVDIRMVHEILGAIGTEVTITVPMLGTRSLIPQAVAFVEVRGEAVEQGLAQLLTEQCGVTLKQNEFQGRTLYYTPLSIEGVRLSPAFTVQNGMLIVASDLRALKSTLRGTKGESLADQPSFRRDAKSSAGASMFACLRLGDNLSKLWRIAEPFAERAESYGVPVKPEMLPTEEELAAALSNVVMSLTVDGSGIVWLEDQPLGIGSVIAAGGRYVDMVLGADVGASTRPRRKIY